MATTAEHLPVMTLADMLANQAQTRAEDVALRFVEPDGHIIDGRASTDTLSFRELHHRACAVAAQLRSVAPHGERVLILCPPGLDYAVALFACFYAGLIAVPAYPPISGDGDDERLKHIIDDCTPQVLLTTSVITSLISGFDKLKIQNSFVIDEPNEPAPDIETRAETVANDVALLQYTSGSTGQPRGVILTHANILANVTSIISLTDGSSRDRGVFWLPPYHDMGLIGGIFTPIVGGAESTLMSPLAFLADPLAWLEVISKQHGTFSAAPNFAYELCVRRAGNAQDRVADLDLSSWRIAINGAEPIRRETMTRFVECFASCGFRLPAFMPCYGMAEATLLISGTRAGVQRPKNMNGESSVSVGMAISDGHIEIVDEAGKPCKDEETGEIWYRGPGVSQGYWQREQETAETFHGVLAHEADKTYLRTGDLGLLYDGELYICGRVKDLIIIRGQNHYPQDIELTATRADTRVRPGCSAAFQIEDHGDQRVVLVAEVTSQLSPLEIDEVGRNIRQLVAREHRITLTNVVVIQRGSSLKTSSGKIRRTATREAYLSGSLALITDLSIGAGAPSPDQGTPDLIVDVITAAMKQALGVESLGCDDDFFAFGGDSLAAVEVVAILEERDISIAPEDLYRFSTPRLLAEDIGDRDTDTASRSSNNLAVIIRGSIARVDDAETYEPSPMQRRWAADYLVDRRKTWGNLSLRTTLPDSGSLPALHRALDAIWRSHEALRTTFPGEGSQVRQRINAESSVDLVEHDFRGLTPPALTDAIAQVASAEAKTVFDLENDTAARAALIHIDDSTSEVILTIHHMLADGWSIVDLRSQIAKVYDDVRAGRSLSIETPAVRYRDYSTWMNELERKGVLDGARSYWLAEFDGELPEMMPVDRAQAESDDASGASVMEILPTPLALAIKDMAIANRVSVSAVLFGGFFTTLREHTGAPDLVIGTPLAGRDRQDLRAVVGMFINLVPIRLRLRSGWSVRDTMSATHEKLLGAVANQRYQLDNLVHDLGINRVPHQFPITNTFFTRLSMGDLTIGDQVGMRTTKDLPIDVRFQSMLYAYDFADGLVIEYRYRKNLFSQETICELLDRYIHSLRVAIE